MANARSLVIKNGTQREIPAVDTLLVGSGIDASAEGALAIGGTTATSITIGQAGVTTSFPGPVELTGGVSTVGGTTFSTDATFEGNITFGDADTDTVDFTAKVDSDVIFTGETATYQIKNIADPTDAQDAATKQYVDDAVDGGVAGNDTEVQFNDNGSFGASSSFTWNGSEVKLPVLALAEGSAPSSASGYGKFYADSADSRPYFLDGAGQAYNLTLDRFNTLTPVSGSVEIDLDPANPIYSLVNVSGNLAFTATNYGSGRGSSILIKSDSSSHSFTWPSGWTWLGSGPPSSIGADELGFLSVVAFGAAEADVVAAWSNNNQPVSLTGSASSDQIATWSGTYTQAGSADFTFDGSTFKVGALGEFSVTTDGNITSINGVTTSFPSAQGADGQVLTNDGSGNLSWLEPKTVAIPAVASESLVAGDVVVYVNASGTTKVAKADATLLDAKLNPVGIAVSAASADGSLTVRVHGVASVPAGNFDTAPSPSDVGKRVYLSTTPGKVTITSPQEEGDIVQRVGVLADGSGSPKILIQIGEPIVL